MGEMDNTRVRPSLAQRKDSVMQKPQQAPEATQTEKGTKPTHETPFMIKPFAQAPDSVIKPESSAKEPNWANRWSRRCGNP